MTNDFSNLMAEVKRATPAGATLPPVDKWHPDLSGDIDICIDRNIRWTHEGNEFVREKLVTLFASILKREEGDYFLVTPVEKWRIEVEDVPFLVNRVERLCVDDKQALVFYTTTGDRTVCGPDTPLRVAIDEAGEPRPYVLVRNGMEGLIARSVFYQLVEFAEHGQDNEKAVYGVYSLGAFFPLE